MMAWRSRVSWWPPARSDPGATRARIFAHAHAAAAAFAFASDALLHVANQMDPFVIERSLQIAHVTWITPVQLAIVHVGRCGRKRVQTH